MKLIIYMIYILSPFYFHVASCQPAHVIANYDNGKLSNYNYLDGYGRIIKITTPWRHNYDTTFFLYNNMILDSPYTTNADNESLRLFSDFSYMVEILSERNIVTPNALLYISEIFDITTMVTLNTGNYSEKHNGNIRIISRTDIESRIRLESSSLTSFLSPECIFHGYSLELNGDTIAKETYYVDDGVITREYEYENSIIKKIEMNLKYNDDTDIYSKDVQEFRIVK